MEHDQAIPRLANWLGVLATAGGPARHAGSLGFRSETDAAALSSLAHFPASTVGELAQVLGVTHSAAVRVANRLAGQGMLVRGRASREDRSTDSRHVSLTLTRLGEVEAARLREAQLTAVEKLLSSLDEARKGQLAELLYMILHEVPRTRSEARWTCRYCDHSVCDGPGCPVGASVPAGPASIAATSSLDKE